MHTEKEVIPMKLRIRDLRVLLRGKNDKEFQKE